MPHPYDLHKPTQDDYDYMAWQRKLAEQEKKKRQKLKGEIKKAD